MSGDAPPRLTLLHPHHPGLGDVEDVHARRRITGHDTILETASIDIADGADVPGRIRRLLLVLPPVSANGLHECRENL